MENFHTRTITIATAGCDKSKIDLSSWHQPATSNLTSCVSIRTGAVHLQSHITPTECRKLAQMLLAHADDFENRVIDDQIIAILGDSEEVRNTLELLTAGEKSELYPFIVAEQDLQRAVAAASSASKKKRAA